MTGFRAVSFVLFAGLIFGQAAQDWQKMTELPAIDLTGLSPAGKTAVLSILRSEACTCGCGLKIAECRVKDPGCSASRRLANFVIREVSSGKNEAAVRVNLKKYANEPPPVLDDPIKIRIDGDPVRGPANAKVTIVEFSDFQCPYCAKAAAEVDKVLKQFPKDVRVVFKQFPLDNHSQAAMAAEASLAAQAQGKFWELHDLLFANFRSIDRAKVNAWAAQSGLDMARFKADLDSHKYAARWKSELKQGEDASVDGTPTFFFNGKKLNASFDVATAVPIIKDELKK